MLWPLLVLLACGCGKQRVERVDISGTVTFQGEPVARGRIDFRPDVTRGNKGPAGFAVIENGAFDTARGRGVVAGPLVAMIQGFGVRDGQDPIPENLYPLFQLYETPCDVEKGRATGYEFDVPKEAARARP